MVRDPLHLADVRELFQEWHVHASEHTSLHGEIPGRYDLCGHWLCRASAELLGDR